MQIVRRIEVFRVTLQHTKRTIMEDDKYVDIFITPLYECLSYNPKFGHSTNAVGYNLDMFLQLYGEDPFYSWIGLDSPYMYTAHKAAGCMTSIYRQIGIGCERLFRQIIFETTGYEDFSSTQWSYPAKTQAGKEKVLTLDGRLEIKDIRNEKVKNRITKWINDTCKQINIENKGFDGVVFEVRQGYKSKDSKRQNGDIDNAASAYAHNYIPVFAVFSSQIDNDIVLRYKNSCCCVLVGNMDKSPHVSLFSFCKDILGYDLAEFFKNNSPFIRKKVEEILKQLFSTNESKK